MKWGRRRKKSTTVNLRKKPDESGGTKKNLEARLPPAPLGVEIMMKETSVCLASQAVSDIGGEFCIAF